MLPKLHRLRVVVIALLALTGCGLSPSPQTQECRDYLACYQKIGGTGDAGAYESTGSCWTTNSPMAQSCTAACVSTLRTLKLVFPDAGC